MEVNVLKSISDGVGIAGVILVLLAYFFINTNRVSSQSISYLVLNFLGAWLILFSLLFHWNLSSVLIEIAWIIISLLGFYRLIIR